MNMQNLNDLPTFINPVVDLPTASQVRRGGFSANQASVASSILLPETRAMLKKLAERDERLADALNAWEGWGPADDNRLAA